MILSRKARLFGPNRIVTVSIPLGREFPSLALLLLRDFRGNHTTVIQVAVGDFM
jgi:hypothetical protein